MKTLCSLSISLSLLVTACARIPGATTDVSTEPLVADYIQTHKALEMQCDILVSGRKSILIEQGRRYEKHEKFHLKHTLPVGTEIVIRRIERIQGDGFVLFEAFGEAFPRDQASGIPFSYKWGHGGTSPRAPWELPGRRLKKILNIE